MTTHKKLTHGDRTSGLLGNHFHIVALNPFCEVSLETTMRSIKSLHCVNNRVPQYDLNPT